MTDEEDRESSRRQESSTLGAFVAHRQFCWQRSEIDLWSPFCHACYTLHLEHNKMYQQYNTKCKRD